jgi:hypothetical protein
MAVVLMIGCGLGWFARSVRVQRNAVTAIERAGGTVRYSFQSRDLDFKADGRERLGPVPRPPIWPMWLVDRLGIDCFFTPAAVVVANSAPQEIMA